MNFLTFLKRFTIYFLGVFKRKRKRPKISILIPFSSNNPNRIANFKWVLKYWKKELPDAEVIVGTSEGPVFCKSEALNVAARKSTGRVLVIMDADAYIAGEILNKCADRILRGTHPLWFVPYRNLYRLSEKTTELIIKSSPSKPLRLNPSLLPLAEEEGYKSKYGHRYGAMCMIFPREAYDVLGCFDERFKGWGGEDVALLRALDTLYGKHKTTNNDIYHLYHPFIGESYQTRKWEGQVNPNINSILANEYHKATRRPTKMRALVDAAYTKINLVDSK